MPATTTTKTFTPDGRWTGHAEPRELRHRYDALTPVDMAAYRRRCAEIRTLDERADRAREV